MRWLNTTQSVSHRMYSTHIQEDAFNRIETPHYYCDQNAHLLKESHLRRALLCCAIHTVTGEDLPSWPLSCFTGGPECCDEGLFSSKWEIVTHFLSRVSQLDRGWSRTCLFSCGGSGIPAMFGQVTAIKWSDKTKLTVIFLWVCTNLCNNL